MKTWSFFAIFLFAQCATQSNSNSTKPTPPNPIGFNKTPMPKSDKKKAATREVVQVGCTTQLTLTRGQILTLKLPATAGTGYLWLLQKSSNHLKWLQSDVLKFEKTEKAESGKVGFAQSQVLTLEALEVGEVSLDWVYVRPTDLENIGNKCLIKVIIQE